MQKVKRKDRWRHVLIKRLYVIYHKINRKKDFFLWQGHKIVMRDPWNILNSVDLSAKWSRTFPACRSVLSLWPTTPSRRMNSLSTNSLIFVHWLGYDTNFGIVPVSRFHILQKKSSQVQSVWCLKGSRCRTVLSSTPPTFIMPHKTSTESSSPISYYIPDTLRNWPWPRALCPHHYVCKAESDAWCESFNALTPEGQKAFTSCDFSPSYYHFSLCATNILVCSRSPRVSQLSLCQ